MTVFTIGHSVHPIDLFVGLLQGAGVTALADVRSVPFSRFQPQFNRPALRQALADAKIAYVFLGDELGARSKDPDCYEDGRIQYPRLAKTALFQAGIDRVLRGKAEYSVALMCAEKEPLECHRTLLVARELDERGVPVVHLHADEDHESHAAAMFRLRARLGHPAFDLFRSEEELREEAYKAQAVRFSYKK